MADGPTQIPAQDHDSFRRNLPVHLGLMGRRLLAMSDHGWDLNGLALLDEDARRLGEMGAQFDLDTALLADLGEVHALVAPCLEAPRLPEDSDGPALRALALRLGAGAGDTRRALAPVPATAIGDANRIEVPPPGYWRGWTGDAAPAQPVVHAAARAVRSDEGHIDGLERGSDTATSGSEAATGGKTAAGAHGAGTGKAGEAAESGDASLPGRDDDAPASGDTQRVYHLTDGSGLGCEIDQRMEAAGWEIELLADAEELRELLAALPPNLVVIDAAFIDGLEDIGAVLRATRQRTGVRIPLAAIVDADELTIRLSARRAGVDALIIDPAGADEVIEALQALLSPPAEAPFRVLIVEDDASQALFAESILRNASMETEVVDDPFDVLPALERFEPDMVLMDLHMPKCNGMELTSLIRDDERFVHLPIVFLSGEADQDVQFEALDAGGDDFIAKPVRPRHLISAVQNRVRRARARTRGDGEAGTVPETSGRSFGLTDRTSLLARIQTAVLAAPERGDAAGGVLFLDVEGSAQLRERLGLSTLEQMLTQATTIIETRLGADALLSRFGDASFLVLFQGPGEDELVQAAQSIRQSLSAYSFEADGKPIRLRFSVGACSLRHGFGDTGDLLNAAERACRDARTSERGVSVYQPPQRPEAAREAALLKRLREAIGGDGFELVYQPIVAVQGGEQAQYQTLLRLREADGRLMPAGELIPIAEREGLMVEVDRWVMDTALKMLADAQAEGHATRLFVPQSVATLGDEGQVQWLRARITDSGVPASALVIELRTDDAVVHTESIATFSKALVDTGVGFCLSRFEFGDHSRHLLEQLPLSFVKLAMKYLDANTAQDVRDELRVLIEHAHRNNQQVIGHRVEDAQSAATLWMSGIDYIQGNLVQRADATTSFDFESAVL